MTPLERAARGICGEFGVDPDRVITAEDDDLIGFGLRGPHPAWTRYVGMARAAFLAVRDPTDAMVAAADALPCSVNTVQCWQAMIDAAIEEQP